jgi:sulfatase maturation enzyme AslB (radical SAM superfamily)
MTRPIGVMEQSLYEKIIRECADNHLKILHLHNFGEPLIDKKFPERIALAKKLGIRKVKFFTNASLLDDKKAEALLDAGADEIKISIDGDSKETFEAIRIGLDYDKVASNIGGLIQLRKKRGMKKPIIKVNFVVREDNRHEMKSFTDKWGSIVDKISFDEEHNWAGKGRTGKVREVLHACLRIWNTFTVLWDGRVSLCCLDYNGKEILGDLNKQTIAEIWSGARLTQIRSSHIHRDFAEIPICHSCSKIR